LRIDGRSFSRFTENLEKPFDTRFQSWMEAATAGLVKELGAVLGYHESDEISLLFRPELNLFDREVEKLVSVSAALATVFFNQAMTGQGVAKMVVPPGTPHFDSRVVVAVDVDQVVDYYSWRQADAGRCCLNGWCHWTAVLKEGLSTTQAARIFDSQPQEFKHEYLFERGVNFMNLPAWQRRGTVHHWTTVEREGFNPKDRVYTRVKRHVLGVNRELPSGDLYRAFVRGLIEPRTDLGESTQYVRKH
jgi:tRNA(His) 5'-end guanylyltransferase